jgi:hypothetical protein
VPLRRSSLSICTRRGGQGILAIPAFATGRLGGLKFLAGSLRRGLGGSTLSSPLAGACAADPGGGPGRPPL